MHSGHGRSTWAQLNSKIHQWRPALGRLLLREPSEETGTGWRARPSRSTEVWRNPCIFAASFESWCVRLVPLAFELVLRGWSQRHPPFFSPIPSHCQICKTKPLAMVLERFSSGNGSVVASKTAESVSCQARATAMPDPPRPSPRLPSSPCLKPSWRLLCGPGPVEDGTTSQLSSAPPNWP